MDTARKHSPLFDTSIANAASMTEVAGWLVADSYGEPAIGPHESPWSVALADVSAYGRLTIGGPGAPDTVAAHFGGLILPVLDGARQGSTEVYRLRHDRYLILTPPGVEEETGNDLAALNLGERLAVVADETHGWAQLRLIGPDSGVLLSHLCGLDFGSEQFPDLSVRQSSVAKTNQIVVRHDMRAPDGGPLLSYSLVGGASLAAYLWDTIFEAGRYLSVRPIGWSTVKTLSVGSLA